MTTHIRKTQIAKFTLCAIAAATFAACGSGAGSGTNSPSESSASPAAAAPTTLSGTVAVGRAIAGANVTLTDSAGKTVTATGDSNGNYQLALNGLTAPFAIFASDPRSVASPLTSVVATVPTASSGPAIANVTTLTTAVAALLTQSGNPLDLSDSKNLSTLVTPTAVAGAVKTLNTALSGILSANNVDSSSFDPISAPFSANQTGADAVIDAVQVVPATGSAGGVQLISNADPNSPANLLLNSSATVAAPLPVPPASGNFLGTLYGALTQCLAGSSASCAQAIDPSYKEFGFTSFAAAHPSLATSGVTIGVPKVLAFLPGTDGKQALIALPYQTSTGSSGFEYTVAHQTASGWVLIGNQQQYNVKVQSFIQRRQTLDNDTSPTNVSRYESGIQFIIPLGAAGTPNPANLASASVTGPGITGTLYYVLPAQAGTNLMSIARAPQTSVPTGGVTSDTQAYGHRWSWQTLPGVTQAFVPAARNLGQKYEAQPIDVQSVPQFATYTITFYDASGNQIGQTTAMNPTPNIAASDGASIPWQTLSANTISSLMTPGGTQTGAASTVNVTWSNLVNGLNVAPVAIDAQFTTQGPVAADNLIGFAQGPAFAVSGSYSAAVTAGVDQSGTQECTSACAFPAFASGVTRNMEIDSNYGAISLGNYWGYTE